LDGPIDLWGSISTTLRTTFIDEVLKETCDGGLSVSAILCSKFERLTRQLISPTILTVLTRRSSAPSGAQRVMLSQKKCVESGELTW